MHIYATYYNISRLGCCHVVFVTHKGGIRRARCAQYQLFWLEMLDVLPRPYHAVQAYLIRVWTLERIYGHTGGAVRRLDGGFDCLLESEAWNLWAAHTVETAKRSMGQIGQ